MIIIAQVAIIHALAVKVQTPNGHVENVRKIWIEMETFQFLLMDNVNAISTSLIITMSMKKLYALFAFIVVRLVRTNKNFVLLAAQISTEN